MKRRARELSAHPRIRACAIRILTSAGVESHDLLGESLAIGRWVQSAIPYVKDPDQIEYLTDPLTLLDLASQSEARGDCDDMSLLIATLLLSIGHTPSFRAVRYYPKKNANTPYQHIYVVDHIQDPKTGRVIRLPIDAIFKDRPIGFEVSHTSAAELVV